MIPILFTGTTKIFTSNGIGRLADIISCKVTEERNGIYECEFEYPSDGPLYNKMVSMVEAYASGDRERMGIVGCIHNDAHDIQPFDLYSYSAPMNGIATFYAHHISYRLNDVMLRPMHASSAAQAIANIGNYIVGNSYSQFTFWTDKVDSGDFDTYVPVSVRSILGGQEGSILDVFGAGEYEFDKFSVKLYANRGINSGVTIRYGKNLVDISREMDSSEKYNAIAPYWTGMVSNEDGTEQEEVYVYLDNIYVQAQGTGDAIIIPMDLSSEFDSQPTKAQLQAWAQNYLANNRPWTPDDNIKVDFVQLWQTTEYENVATLQRVSLCDTVSVYYPQFGITKENQKVIRVVYDVILERYSEMELGKSTTTLADSIASDIRSQYESDLDKARKMALTYDMLKAAIDHATDAISGGLGGYVVFTLNADDQPQEILIMDTDDINTAVNVWRFNKNGLGHSHNGYNGPFSDVALTSDGAINAAMITTGQLNANIIKAGILQDMVGRNYWNLQTGEFQLVGYATDSELSSASSSTLSSAKTYADSKDSTNLTNAKKYSDNNLKNAKAYANGTLSDAKEYSDNNLGIAKSYATSEAALAATGAVSDYDANLTQQKVFNKLTNNGSLQGIFMRNNNLYINASYISSGTLKLGGNNNTNGLLQIYDANNQVVGQMNKDGVLTSALVASDYIYLAGALNSYLKIPFGRAWGIDTYLELSSTNGFKLVGDQVTTWLDKTTYGLMLARTTATSTTPTEYTKVGTQGVLVYGRVHYASFGEDGFYVCPAGGSNPLVYMGEAAGEYGSQYEIYIAGNLVVTGNKNRLVQTRNFGGVKLSAYETPTPMFGDIGDGRIDESGKVTIFIDPVFNETVSLDTSYYIFLQPYGEGECWVSERNEGFFIVEGTPGLKFAWEIKAKQKNYDQLRFEKFEIVEDRVEKLLSTNEYEDSALEFIESIQNSYYDEEGTQK